MFNAVKLWFNSNEDKPVEDTRINLQEKKYDPRQFDVHFTIKDLVEPYGVSQRKLYYDASSGKLRTFKRGNLKLVDLEDAISYGQKEIPSFDQHKLFQKMIELVENNYLPDYFDFEIKYTEDDSPFIYYRKPRKAKNAKVSSYQDSHKQRQKYFNNKTKGKKL